MKFSSTTSRIVLAAALLTPTVTAVASQLGVKPALAAKATKYQVCHRTNAIKNPYRLISVAWSSVNPDGNGHDNPVHDGPVFNIADPVGSHGTTPRDSGLGSEAGGSNNRWGDIFYAFKNNGQDGENSNNWTVAGQAIFNGATFTINGVTKVACRRMTAMDYIRSEREEDPTKTMDEIMSDLDEQGATDDAPLKKKLLPDGSFSNWLDKCKTDAIAASADPSTCEDTDGMASKLDDLSPAVTTEVPTNVSDTRKDNESGRLNGTVSPKGQNGNWYFEFSDDPNLSNPQQVPSTPGDTNSATTENVSYNATGLSSGKTYYYRTVLVIPSGTDEEPDTVLYGDIKQFSYNPLETNDDPLGRVIGTAWFDLNKDDKYQSNEPLLRGVDVQLTPKNVNAQSSNGRVRKQAYIMKTDNVGAFDFTDLQPGTYTIKSLLPGDFGITPSWDSGGKADWLVTVTVVARKTSRGDFAAIGEVQTTGCVSTATNGTVSATWNGFDQTAGTADDTVFTTTINSDCTFTLNGVPTGKYVVTAKSKTGKVYATSALRIARNGGMVRAGKITLVTRIVKVLPATGSRDSAPLGMLAVSLLAAGLVVSGATNVRRRRLTRR